MSICSMKGLTPFPCFPTGFRIWSKICSTSHEALYTLAHIISLALAPLLFSCLTFLNRLGLPCASGPLHMLLTLPGNLPNKYSSIASQLCGDVYTSLFNPVIFCSTHHSMQLYTCFTDYLINISVLVEQRLANYGHMPYWASHLLCMICKYIHACSSMYCLWMLSCYSGRVCDLMDCKAQIFTIWLFIEKLC